MRLSTVCYGVFAHEREQFSGPGPGPNTPWHQLDGEIRLTFANAPVLFVSWGNGPPQHCVETQGAPFFRGAALEYVDVSSHLFWRPLIGQEITLSSRDPESQLLVVAGIGCSVRLSSQYDDGDFYGDCIRVSRGDAT